MKVNILTKRNIQPNILSHMEQFHSGEKSAVERYEYNNGPTKDVSFRGSAVIKASDYWKAIFSKSARQALENKKLRHVPEYAIRLVDSKKFTKIIEKTRHNEGLVEAAIALGLTTTLKPLCTLIMPGTKKEDKEVIATKHVLSGLIGFGFSKLLYTPFAEAIKKIEKNPERYIKNPAHKKFIEAYDNGGKFKDGFNTLWKKGPDVLMSIPKSILTVALITPLLAFLFPHHKKAKSEKQAKQEQQKSSNSVIEKNPGSKALTFKGQQKSGNLSFMGLGKAIGDVYDNAMQALAEPLAKGIGKIGPTKPVQGLSNGLTHFKKPGAFMSNLASVVLTLSLLNNTAKSKKIEKERKPYLLLNTALVTAISSTVSVIFDHCTDGVLESIKKAYMKKHFKFDDDTMVKALDILKEYAINGKRVLNDATKKVISSDQIAQIDDYMRGVDKFKSYTIFSFIVRFATPLLVVPLTSKIMKIVENIKKKKQEAKSINNTQTVQPKQEENVKKA